MKELQLRGSSYTGYSLYEGVVDSSSQRNRHDFSGLGRGELLERIVSLIDASRDSVLHVWRGVDEELVLELMEHYDGTKVHIDYQE